MHGLETITISDPGRYSIDSQGNVGWYDTITLCLERADATIDLALSYEQEVNKRSGIRPLTITAALQGARQNKTCSLKQNGRLKAAVLFCYFIARNRRVPVHLQTTFLRLKSR